MTTARQMIPAIGVHVFVRFESLTVECWIKDVKNSYGKPRLLIVPVTGEGEQWVELGRVTVPTDDAADMLARQPAGARAINAALYPKYTVNGRACTDYKDAQMYQQAHGGTIMEKLDAMTPWHAL